MNAYLPRGRWYDIQDKLKYDSDGKWVTFDAPLEKINVHIRGGKIIPRQASAPTTTQT